MADANNTGFGDVVVPQVFADYVQVRTATRSALVQSGIAVADARLEAKAAGGGDYVEMPHWGDLGGESETLPDGETADAALTPGQITAASQVAVKQFRGRAWSANDMAGLVAGSDPMQAMAAAVADWWLRDEQTRVVAMLAGLFAAGGALAATHLYDVSGGGRKLTGEVVLEAAQLLGDRKDSLSAIAMHSGKHTALQAQNLIEYVRDPESGEIAYSTWLGRRVIVDDGCPVAGGVYTSYLFGPGALARVPVPVQKPIETQRFALEGNDVLVSRQGLILHPAGCSYVSGTAGRNPSNATLALATSWERVWESKLIRVVAIKTA